MPATEKGNRIQRSPIVRGYLEEMRQCIARVRTVRSAGVEKEVVELRLVDEEGEVVLEVTLDADTRAEARYKLARALARCRRMGMSQALRLFWWDGARFSDRPCPPRTWACEVARLYNIALGDRKVEVGSLYDEIRKEYQADPEQDRLLAVSPFGRCPGIPLRDGVLSWSEESRDWRLTATQPENANFWALQATWETLKSTYQKPDYLEGSLLYRFITSSFSPAQQDFLQQWAGYHLVRHRLDNEEKFVILQGAGGDGKSQYLRLLEKLAGESAGALFLPAHEIDRRTTELMEGKVAMLSSETKDRLDLEKIKALVSGEDQLVEPKFRDPYITKSVRPLLTIATNRTPLLSDRSDAVARRLIYLEVEGPEKDEHNQPVDRIKDLAAKIFATEHALLCTWALHGAARVLAQGELIVPAEIQASTRKIVRETDAAYLFLMECLEFNEEAEISLVELAEVYQRWQDSDKARRPLNRQDLVKELMRLARAQGQFLTIKKARRQYYRRPPEWLDRRGGLVPVTRRLPVRPDTLRGVWVPQGKMGNEAAAIGMLMQEDARGGARHPREVTREVPG